MSGLAPLLRLAAALLAALLVACNPPIDGGNTPGDGLTLRLGMPGQACMDLGFVGWQVEVRQGGPDGPIVAQSYIEPFPFTVDGEFAGLDPNQEYTFGDFYVGVLPADDYHVLAYGVTDPGPPPVAAWFMEPAETMVTVVAGRISEIVLVVRCDVMPGGLDVVVVVQGAPSLIDFDIDQKWVASCQATRFQATIGSPGSLDLVAEWTMRDASGATVLYQTEDFPAGTPPPVVVTFDAWLPTPGDYEGTLTLTDSAGSVSEFVFPWHVRYPNIAFGACDDDGAPLLMMSCDTSDGYDGIPLADDPVCLVDAYGSTGTCAAGGDLGIEHLPGDGLIADFDGAYLEAWLYRGYGSNGGNWQLGLRWSDETEPTTLPLDACDFPRDAATAWELTITPGATTAAVRLQSAACADPVTLTIPWDAGAPLDTYVLQAELGPGQTDVGLDLRGTSMTDAQGTCGIADVQLQAEYEAEVLPDVQPPPPGAGQCTSLGYPYGFKIDRTPSLGVYPLITSSSAKTELLSGTPSQPEEWVEITRLYKDFKGSNEVYGVDWSSSFPIDAVLVKARETNVYVYDPPATSGTRNETIQRKEISHVTFCYGPATGGSGGTHAAPVIETVSWTTSVTGTARLNGTLTPSWRHLGLPGDAHSARLYLGRTGRTLESAHFASCDDLHLSVCGP